MTRRRDGGLAGSHRVHALARADDWETPADVFGPLNAEFGFTLDAAASTENAKCARFFSSHDDGVSQDWGRETVWLNPPYGREIARWIRKAFLSARHGATVVCLVPARTDTAWWHDYAEKGEVRFVRGRIRFERGGIPIGDTTKGSAKSPFPSAIIVFRPPAQETEAA
jgi:phage N-6-adenine-methyltransferase